MKKKATISDIAKLVGVSVTTVSLVLNNKPNTISISTKDKIFKIAKELNYIPSFLAKGLVTKKTYTIGLVIPDIQNPFFSEMAKVIASVAEVSGYTVIIFNTFNDKQREEQGIRHLVAKGVDGVILAPLGSECTVVDILKDNKIPFVISDRIINNSEDLNMVYCDSQNAIKLGVKYLYDKGKRNIAYISERTQSKVIKLRLDTYIDEMKKLKIYNENLNEIEPITLQGGFDGTKKLLDKNIKIDAIMCCSDMLAVGAIKYLVRSGYSIPNDISVLGFDNIDICEFIEPELTTIAQPIDAIGRESIKLLIKIIDNTILKPTKICLEAKIVERNT